MAANFNYMEWSNRDYCIGLAVVDSQHQSLFQIYNSLVSLIKTSPDPAKMELGDVAPAIAKLVDYAAIHFSTEEDVYYNCNWEGRFKHKAVHTSFQIRMNSVYKTLTKYPERSFYILSQVLAYISKWIITHILKDDLPALKSSNACTVMLGKSLVDFENLPVGKKIIKSGQNKFVGLQKIITSKIGVELFKRFLISEFSIENLVFYFKCDEVNDFKALVRLYATFISNDKNPHAHTLARYESYKSTSSNESKDNHEFEQTGVSPYDTVNISSAARKTIENLISKAETNNGNVSLEEIRNSLVMAKREVFHNMEDSLSRFYTCTIYDHFLLLCGEL